MKLMIATPCHGGKVDNTFTISLLQSIHILDRAGIETQVLLPATGSILSKERNKIVNVFMDSDCTHLLCIDSDLGWHPEAPLRFLNYNKGIVAGVYPARTSQGIGKKYLFIPKLLETGAIESEGPLLKMLGVPAGFLMMSRDAVQAMRDFYPNLRCRVINVLGEVEEAHAFFNTELIDGEYWGEDYVFCKRATGAGLDIWCDPVVPFNHAGVQGSLVEVLTDTKPINTGMFEYKTG